jgi:multidrug resistance efflux pump
MKTIGNRWLLFGGLGVAVLTASLLGAGWLLGPTWAGDTTEGSAAPPTKDERLFAIAYVDTVDGVAPLYPLQPGRVKQVKVHEQQSVCQGQALLVLDDELAQLRVQEAEADLAAARELLVQAKKLPLQHVQQLAQQKEAVAAAKHRVDRARRICEHKRELNELKYFSRMEVDAAEAQVGEAEAGQRADEARLQELKLIDPQVSVKRAVADVQAKTARLAQARRLAEEHTLCAPADGTVLRVLVKVGELLGAPAREPAVQFCAAGPRIVRAEVEQEFAYRVQLGQTATIQDDTRGDTKWKGKVTRISDWFTRRRSILLEPGQFNDMRTLECIVSLDNSNPPAQPPLRIGQRVRVVLDNAASQ